MKLEQDTSLELSEGIGKAGLISVIIGAIIYVIQNSSLDIVWKNFFLQYCIPLFTLILNHYARKVLLMVGENKKRKLRQKYKAINEEALCSKYISQQRKTIIKNNLEKIAMSEITDAERELNKINQNQSELNITN